MPVVSVVVPVYKVEPYLRRCVDSIMNQTYTDFQLILVDDGSPDNCGKICDEYAEKDSRIHVIHRENGGLSAARNSGIDWMFEHSYTEWITFIDSDDWVTSSYLEVLLGMAHKFHVNISIGGFLPVKDGDVIGQEKCPFEREYGPEEYWVEKQGDATVAWGKLYKSDLFKLIRYPEGKLHEDEFTTYKLLFSEKSIAVTNDKLYYYYQSSTSIMRSNWTMKKMDGLVAYEEQMLYFKQNGYLDAYKESYKLHTYKLRQIKEQIKLTDNPKTNSTILYRQIRSYLYQQYGKIMLLPLTDYCFTVVSDLKLFVSVRYKVLVRTLKEQGFKGVFRKITHH